MTNGNRSIRRSWKYAACLTLGAVFQLGFLESCDDRLVAFTRFIDPCATFLANCQPGDFEVNAADIGDFCVDPTCTIPGGCGNVGPALGTVTDICP